MELQRTIYAKLLSWKEESRGSRALLIEGACRVGKSTIAERFAKERYRSHILVDFNMAPKIVRDNFDNIDRPDIFFQNLSLHYNTRLYSRESLVVFDEIQRFLKAREAIKCLVADGRFGECDDPLFWLGDSMMCNLCYRTTDPNVGFALTADPSSVKCYLGDTGLQVSHAFSENEIAEAGNANGVGCTIDVPIFGSDVHRVMTVASECAMRIGDGPVVAGGAGVTAGTRSR